MSATPPVDPLVWITEADHELLRAVPTLHVAPSPVPGNTGHTRATIATALDTTRQAARQRFGHRERAATRRPLPDRHGTRRGNHVTRPRGNCLTAHTSGLGCRQSVLMLAPEAHPGSRAAEGRGLGG